MKHYATLSDGQILTIDFSEHYNTSIVSEEIRKEFANLAYSYDEDLSEEEKKRKGELENIQVPLEAVIEGIHITQTKPVSAVVVQNTLTLPPADLATINKAVEHIKELVAEKKKTAPLSDFEYDY